MCMTSRHNQSLTVLLLFFCSAVILLTTGCTDKAGTEQTDQLNTEAYRQHYRSREATASYASAALHLADSIGYRAGKAEALNNMAFVATIEMRYDEARRLLDQALDASDNQVERLIALVQQMRLCQRRSANRDFYNYRERALRTLDRINEERELLDERAHARLLYAESEMAIVTSTYFYYVGLERQSTEELQRIPDDIEADTAQFLNYLYNLGAGGAITADSREEVEQMEMDCLTRCLQIAQKHNYPFFAANAQEAIAEHLLHGSQRQRIIDNNLPAITFINPEEISIEQLPIWLADSAQTIFLEYGDTYQIAGAYRTMAACYREEGNYSSALFYLQLALADTTINQAPDLVASIREQLSVVYAAIDDKQMSRINRNTYLDLQEETRQDRMLEARAMQLDESVATLNKWLAAVTTAILLLITLLIIFVYLERRQRKTFSTQELLLPLQRFRQKAALEQQTRRERREEIEEQTAVAKAKVETYQRRQLDQRAQATLAVSCIPYIDRLLYHLHRQDDTDYTTELLDQIDSISNLLTRWIEMRRGDIRLNISTFAVEEIFDILRQSEAAFRIKGITLDILPSDLRIKADRVLTVFMLNTLADNARKATQEGGKVTIAAEGTEDYVELSVADNGRGLTKVETEKIFQLQIDEEEDGGVKNSKGSLHKGGFGLLNCRGIIEKLKKTSRIFSVCTLGVESEPGKGSRFYFRLPRALMALLLTVCSLTVSAKEEYATKDSVATQIESRIAALADSVYFAYMREDYTTTLSYAESSLMMFNRLVEATHQEAHDTLSLGASESSLPTEVTWLHNGYDIPYDLLLAVRNEAALAALALHEWDIYYYNNKIYTQLFKELSADNTLDDYCRHIEQIRTNRTIAIIILVLAMLAILPAYYFVYGRHRIRSRQALRDLRALNEELNLADTDMLRSILKRYEALNLPTRLDAVRTEAINIIKETLYNAEADEEQEEYANDTLRRIRLDEANLHVALQVADNRLSQLKHETMYYPSRLRMLKRQDDLQELTEVAQYYRKLYGILAEQVAHQTSRFRLHLEQLDYGLLGDRNLISYLFDILRQQAKPGTLSIESHDINEQHVELRCRVPGLKRQDGEQRSFFTPEEQNIPFMLCNQIVRDHSEATHRREYGIKYETDTDGSPMIVIILPKAHTDNHKNLST